MKTMSVERMVVCCCWLITSAGSVLPMALDLTFIVEEATLETSTMNGPNKHYSLRQTMEWHFIPYWLDYKKREQKG